MTLLDKNIHCKNVMVSKQLKSTAHTSTLHSVPLGYITLITDTHDGLWESHRPHQRDWVLLVYHRPSHN